MKTLYIKLLIILSVVTTSHCYAQLFIPQYTIGFPMGNTKDFIGAASFRGAALDFRYSATPNIKIGFSTGWSTFYESFDYDTYTSSEGTLSVSGKMYRYLNSIPFLAMADYYFTPEETLSPFVGVGIGVTYNRLENKMGVYDVEVDNWQFTVSPEAGLSYGITTNAAAYVSVRYMNCFEAADLDTQSYLSLNIGFILGIR